MKSVFEIAYRYLIPTIRREIVKMLIRRGFMEIEVVDRIARKDIDFYQIYEEIDRIALYALSNRYLCSTHKAIEPYIDISKCNICSNLFSQQKVISLISLI